MVNVQYHISHIGTQHTEVMWLICKYGHTKLNEKLSVPKVATHIIDK